MRWIIGIILFLPILLFAQYGNNEITNGTFGDATDWTLEGTAAIQGDTLLITGDGTSANHATFTVSAFVSGDEYKFEYDVTHNSLNVQNKIYTGGSGMNVDGGDQYFPDAKITVASHTVTLTATGSIDIFRLRTGGGLASGNIGWDNFVYRKKLDTLYIDPDNGNDADLGDFGNPILTWTEAWARGTYAGGVFAMIRGSEIREQITIPASGSSGLPITLTAYGTGADPIINGADLADGWQDTTHQEIGEQQITSNYEDLLTKGSDDFFLAEGIKSDTEIIVPRIDLELKKAGVPTGNIWVELWATTGSPSRPTGGAAHGVSDSVDVSTVGTSMEWVEFNFSTAPTLAAATDYIMIFMANYGSSDDSCVHWDLSTAENYRGAVDPYNRQKYDDSTPPANEQSITTQDFSFKVYKTATGDKHYLAGITTPANGLWFRDTLGTEVVDSILVNSEKEWYWGSDTLWVFSSDTTNIEYGQRDYCINNAKNYITFDNLQLEKSNSESFGNLHSSGTNITIQNCDISYATHHGIVFTGSSNNLTTLNNIHHNGSQTSSSGIYGYQEGASAGNENTISYNNIYNNYECGIQLLSNYYIIDHNTVYDNGNTTGACVGIEVIDWTDTGYGRYHTIRYNEVYNQISGQDDGEGIYADDWSGHVNIYYNICYNNDGPGIGIHRADSVKVHNNTLYDNCQNSSGALTIFAEIKVLDDNDGESDSLSIKNNLIQATQANTYAIYFDAYTYNMNRLDVTNNDYYTSASNWYYWNNGGGSSLSTWNALTGVGTDLNSDPLFTDAANNDFTLQSGSPAIDAGTDVGLTVDYLGNGLFGSAWDIGAYEDQTNSGYEKRYKRYSDYWRYKRY